MHENGMAPLGGKYSPNPVLTKDKGNWYDYKGQRRSYRG